MTTMTTDLDLRGIDPLPSGKWRVRLRGAYLGVHPTVDEAVRVRDAAELLHQAGEMEPSTKLTVGSFMSDLLVLRRRAGKRAWKDERSLFENHIKPHTIAKLPLSGARRGHVYEWLQELAAKPHGRDPSKNLSGKTMKNVLGLLKLSFNEAMARELRKDNPCKGQKVPREIDPNAWDYFSVEEQTAIMECDAPEPLVLLVLFAMWSGLRCGEQIALRIDDVVVDGPDPHVMVRFGNRAGGPPKNGKHRKVILFGLGLEVARRWLEWRELLPNPGAKWFFNVPVRYFRRTWKGSDLGGLGIVMKAAGIAPRPHLTWHSLRHTCASSLVAGWWCDDDAKPWTLAQVRDQLGHSTITITQRYAHLAASSLRDRANTTTAGTCHTACHETGKSAELLRFRAAIVGLLARWSRVQVPVDPPAKPLRYLPGAAGSHDTLMTDSVAAAEGFLVAVASGRGTLSWAVDVVEALRRDVVALRSVAGEEVA